MTRLSAFPALLAVTMTAACFSVALSPADAAEARTRIVRLADFDLGRADDRAALEKQLKAAARAVCARGNDAVSRSIEETCVRDALAGIATQRS